MIDVVRWVEVKEVEVEVKCGEVDHTLEKEPLHAENQ